MVLRIRPRTVVRVCRHQHPGFRLTFLDSPDPRPDPTEITVQTMQNGSHLRFLVEPIRKKLDLGRTIVADRLSSKYGELALGTGLVGETPGAALTLAI